MGHNYACILPISEFYVKYLLDTHVVITRVGSTILEGWEIQRNKRSQAFIQKHLKCLG